MARRGPQMGTPQELFRDIRTYLCGYFAIGSPGYERLLADRNATRPFIAGQHENRLGSRLLRRWNVKVELGVRPNQPALPRASGC